MSRLGLLQGDVFLSFDQMPIHQVASHGLNEIGH